MTLQDVNFAGVDLSRSFFTDTFTFIRSIAFSPGSNNTLASASADGTIKLWDVHKGEIRQTLRAPGPYGGMNIAGVTGLTEAQKRALKVLGVAEQSPSIAPGTVKARPGTPT